jgi:hypothetical protein
MIEKKLRDKIAQLIACADAYAEAANQTERGVANATAWVTEALNVVQLAVPDRFQPYRQQIELAVYATVSQKVLTIAATLRSLLADVDLGLVSTLANTIRAEAFDNFLDHAVEYQKRKRKNEAGVIAAGVFEDTMRKIYADKIDKFSRPDLEQVIIVLTKKEVITVEQEKQARVAQLVRNKAAHADWDGFTMQGVDDTIKITKALIEAHLK